MCRVNNAVSLFKKGYNWTQALLAAYGDKLEIEDEQALKLGNAFGGGMGRMGETCGAVAGALMIVGLACGQKDLDSINAKEKTYRLASEFIKAFRGRNNSIVCCDLLGFRLSPKNDLSPDEIKSIMKKCPKYVQDASEILQEIL